MKLMRKHWFFNRDLYYQKLNDVIVKNDNAKRTIDYFYNEPYSLRKKISNALEMPESTVN